MWQSRRWRSRRRRNRRRRRRKKERMCLCASRMFNTRKKPLQRPMREADFNCVIYIRITFYPFYGTTQNEYEPKHLMWKQNDIEGN